MNGRGRDDGGHTFDPSEPAQPAATDHLTASRILKRSFPLSHTGFTLTELLVVIGVLTILASLLLPALARAKATAAKVVCLNNLRQLQLAWQLYADDNTDRLVINGDGWENLPSWVNGVMAFDQGLFSTDGMKELSIDKDLLVERRHALFAPYIAAAGSYKCPADRSTVVYRGKTRPRVRSYSMNRYLGYWLLRMHLDDRTGVWSDEPVNERMELNPRFRNTLASLSDSSPTQLLVFVEPHDDSITKPVLEHMVENEPWWGALPTSRHNGSAILSFADGHGEVRKWLDARTRKPVERKYIEFGIEATGSPDLRWFNERLAPDRNR